MLNFKVFLQFIFSICLLLFFAFPLASQEDNRTVINIENANNTRYEKDKTTNNDMIILTGAVKISVARGSNKNSINADIVRYDRTAEMIYAEGNVSLEHHQRRQPELLHPADPEAVPLLRQLVHPLL